MVEKRFFKKKRFWLTAGIAVAVGAGGWYGYQRRQKKKKEAAEKSEAELTAVTRGDLEVRFKEIGEIDAKDFVDVASKVSGRIIKLHVEEGDRIQKGQPICVVQPGKTGAEKYLPSTVIAPLSGILTRFTRESNNRSDVSHFTKVGDYVTGLFESGTPTYLMTIADLKALVVRLKISEMDVFKLREDMLVEVSVDAIPGKKFPAVISMISPKAELDGSGLKVFRVEVELKHKDKQLMPGITARIDALLEKKSGVLKLKRSGLFEEAGKFFVYLHNPEGQAKQVEVKTGLKTALDAEILEGLKEGDKVHTEKPKDFIALGK
ncbi:MAG: efflux RND transporter periplasmic adaptor subunit [Elusimicrobiota bacterium]